MAVWTDNGKEVIREAKAVVRAGETTEINLLVPPMAQKKTIPEEKTAPVKKPDPEKKPTPEKKAEPEKPPPEKKPEPKIVLTPEKKPESEKKPKVEKKPEQLKKPKPKPPVPKPVTPTVSPVPPASPSKASLSLVMSDTLSLRPGETKLLPIKVIRTGFEGPITLNCEALPFGIAIKAATVPMGKGKVYLEVSAAKETTEQEVEVKLVGAAERVSQTTILKVKVVK